MGKPGKITIITGPMFAGKTTKLISEMLKARKQNKRTVLFKSAVDTRYSKSEVVSHDGLKLEAQILPEGQECLTTLRNAAANYDIIGIDEGHFWDGTRGLPELLDDLAFGSKSIYISMLNRKSIDGKAFDIGKELIPIADKIHHLESKCAKCGKGATFTQRIVSNKDDKNESLVGGIEAYEARCRKCFIRPI